MKSAAAFAVAAAGRVAELEAEVEALQSAQLAAHAELEARVAALEPQGAA